MKTTIIIIAYVFVLLGSLTALALTFGKNQEVKKENFVGIDAAGYKHYPNGDIERMKNY